MTFGEHKGFGMAMACELLGGALTGGGTWHRPADTTRTILNGMLTVLIDPARLGTQAAFAQEATAFVDWLRQSPPGAGFEGVQIAGEPERAARVARERDGIVLDDTTWGEIVDGTASIQEMGQRIFELVLATASGAPSKSEQHGYGQNEFVPWQVGAVM